MSSGIFNFDDLQAEDNRRQEVLVSRGASPSALENGEPSELRKIFYKWLEETQTDAAKEFMEYRKTHPLPGYNFVSYSEEDEKREQDAAKKAQEESKRLSDLLEEADKNEFKVTDTSTGLPRQEPYLTDEERELAEARKKRLSQSRKVEMEAMAKGLPTAPIGTPKGATLAGDQQKTGSSSSSSEKK